MRITLATPDRALLAAWETHCAALPDVTLHAGSIFDVACDALVSPANSFGFMDGGLDALYMDRFGPVVQDRVRMRILERHHGELVVGHAEIVATDDEQHPYLIAAPTMRVPMVLPADSINPFLATRAVLVAVREGQLPGGRAAHDAISSVAFPGMGTGVGRISPDICARQMRQAIVQFRSGRYALPSSWAEASEDHQRLYTDKPRRLQ